MPMPADNGAQATRGRQLLTALRVNMWLVTLATGVISGAVGLLISATLGVSDVRHQLADLNAKVGSSHSDMVSVDQRINDATARLNEIRRQLEQEAGLLKARTDVLDAQMHFLADRSPTPQLGSRR